MIDSVCVCAGTDPLLGPGSLLAVPPLVAKQLAQELKTVPGRAMLQVCCHGKHAAAAVCCGVG